MKDRTATLGATLEQAKDGPKQGKRNQSGDAEKQNDDREVHSLNLHPETVSPTSRSTQGSKTAHCLFAGD
jgi:hypothetical protein